MAEADEPRDDDSPDRGRDASAAVARRRRFASLLAAAIVVLTAMAVILVFATPRGRERQSLGPVAAASTAAEPTPVEPSRPGDRDLYRLSLQLQAATVAALHRVAPTAVLESDHTSFTIVPAQGYSLHLFIRVGQRLGGLLVHTARSRHEPCEGFSPDACRRTAGPHGEIITIAHFNRTVPAGQPRDSEIRATVHRPGGSWVQVSINNAAALSSPPNPTPRTGQPPPITEEQAAALASDPALDLCATSTDDPCRPT
jgi:hypothetical protein